MCSNENEKNIIGWIDAQLTKLLNSMTNLAFIIATANANSGNDNRNDSGNSIEMPMMTGNDAVSSNPNANVNANEEEQDGIVDNMYEMMSNSGKMKSLSMSRSSQRKNYWS